jgi:hypothetical protein
MGDGEASGGPEEIDYCSMHNGLDGGGVDSRVEAGPQAAVAAQVRWLARMKL